MVCTGSIYTNANMNSKDAASCNSPPFNVGDLAVSRGSDSDKWASLVTAGF